MLDPRYRDCPQLAFPPWQEPRWLLIDGQLTPETVSLPVWIFKGNTEGWIEGFWFQRTPDWKHSTRYGYFVEHGGAELDSNNVFAWLPRLIIVP